MLRPFQGKILCGIQGTKSRSHALCIGFRELGYDAQLLTLGYAHYEKDILEKPELFYRPYSVRFIQWLNDLRPKSYPLPAKMIIAVASEFTRFLIFFQILWSFDTLVLTCETSFFKFRLKSLRPPPLVLMKFELIFLRFFKKKLVFQFIGGDTRPMFLDGMMIITENLEYIIRYTRFQKSYYSLISKYADLIIDIPHQGGYYLTRPFYELPYIGMPVVVEEKFHAKKAIKNSKLGDIPLVIHCPSETGRKGTNLILNIFENLKMKGILFEFELITNMSQHDVHFAMSKADLIVDQAYADSPLSKTAVESAWIGTPVISSGYSACYWQENFKEITKLFGHVEIDKLEETIEVFLLNKDDLPKKGQDLNRFVVNNWGLSKIAQRILDELQFKQNPQWLFAPNMMTKLLGGFFMPNNELKIILKEILTIYGSSSFKLDDKPELLQDLLGFINDPA